MRRPIGRSADDTHYHSTSGLAWHYPQGVGSHVQSRYEDY